MIIDSHCHLDYEPMYSNLDQVISRALEKNIKYMLSISTTNSSYEKILILVKKYKNIYGTYGIHPHETTENKITSSKDIITKISNNKKIIGIGETGLDFYYKNWGHRRSENVYRSYQDFGKSRRLNNRENDFIVGIKEEKKKKDFKILIHCFTGTKNSLIDYLDLGVHIGSGVTFKKSHELAETFSSLPNDRILVETDSPYLAPTPFRGTINEPKNCFHTVDFLSKLKAVNYEVFSKITSENFLNLIGKIN